MSLADLLYPWLIHSALAGLAVLAVGSGVVVLCHQPVRRIRIIELTLIGCLIVPWLGLIPGYPQLSLARRNTTPPEEPKMPLSQPVEPLIRPPVRVVVPPLLLPGPHRAGATAGVSSSAASTGGQATRGTQAWIVGLYLLGVAIATAWWLVGIAQVAWIVWMARPAPARCRALLTEIAGRRADRVRLLLSRRLNQPFASAWGGRPLIVLPEKMCDDEQHNSPLPPEDGQQQNSPFPPGDGQQRTSPLPPGEGPGVRAHWHDEQSLRWCLAHEWAHVERHDFRAWLLAGVVRVLFFYQPLLWWLRRQLRLCQDFVADAQAARLAPQPEDYAEFLTARAAAGSLHPAIVGVAVGFRKSELYRRVIMLLKNEPLESRPPRLWNLSATLAALVLVAAAAALSLSPRVVAAEKPDASAASGPSTGGQATRGTEEPPARIDLAVVVARHVLLLEGKEIITWAELEKKIAALPDPSQAYPHFYITRGAYEAGVQKRAKGEMWRLHQKFKLKGHSEGSLWPRVDFRYDQIETAKDLVPDESLRVKGRIVDGKGGPVAGAEVLLVAPVDKSIPYKSYHVALLEGRVRNPLEEIMTHSDDQGQFSLYPPKGVNFYVVGLHPTAGFNLARSNQFARSGEVRLLPWASLVSKFAVEAGQRQEASLRTVVQEKDGLPEVIFNQYWSVLKKESPTEEFRYTHVPPIFATTISRDFPGEQGGSIGLPGATVGLLPGESRRLDLGPLSDKQREQLEWMRKKSAERRAGTAAGSSSSAATTGGQATRGTQAGGTGSTPAAEKSPADKAEQAESGSLIFWNMKENSSSTEATAGEKSPADKAEKTESGTFVKTGSGTLILHNSGETIVNSKSTEDTKPDSEKSFTKTGTGVMVITGSMGMAVREASGYIFLPGYFPLAQQAARKELKLSAEQEQKLREISRNYGKQLQQSGEQFRKEIEKLSPQERIAKQREIRAALDRETKAQSKQIEGVLTAEQLTALKALFVGEFALGRLMYDDKFGEKIGLTQEQRQQLARLLEDVKEKAGRLDQVFRENEEKSLTVFTPQQWEQLEKLVETSDIDSLGPGTSHPGPLMMEVQHPQTRQELNLSPEQQTKLEAIFARSQDEAQKLSKRTAADTNFSSSAEQDAKNAQQFQQKLEALGKQDREQVAAVLTPQQLATLKKNALRHTVLHSLDFAARFGSLPGSTKLQELLQRVQVSQEQKDQLRRLQEEKERSMLETQRQWGEKALKVLALTPQQQEKLFDELSAHPGGADVDVSDESPTPEKKPAADKPAGGESAKAGNFFIGQMVVTEGVIVLEGDGAAKTPTGVTAGSSSGAASTGGQATRGTQEGTGGHAIATARVAASTGASTTGGVGDEKWTTTVGGPLEPEPTISTAHPNDLDFPFYQPLLNDRTRKLLNLSSQQQKKLQEMDRNYRAGLQNEVKKIYREMRQTEKLPPKEQQKKQEEISARVRETVKPLRHQVEQLLTAEQLSKLREMVLCDRPSPMGVLANPHGELTEEQKKDLHRVIRLEGEFQMQTYEKILQADRENDEKVIAALSPQQLQQIERQVAEGDFGRPVIFGQQLSFQFTTPPGVGHTDYPMLWEVRKELGLSQEQRKKLEAISVNSEASRELYKLSGKNLSIRFKSGSVEVKGGGTVVKGSGTVVGTVVVGNISARTGPPSAEKQKATPPEVQQQWEELKKQFRQQIEGVLTPEQLATLKKVAQRKAVAQIVRNLWLRDEINVNATQQQKEAMRRLNDERVEAEHQLRHKKAEDTLKALSPELREKCFEEEERRGWWW